MYALSYRFSQLALLAFTLSVAGSLQTASGNAITEVNQTSSTLSGSMLLRRRLPLAI